MACLIGTLLLDTEQVGFAIEVGVERKTRLPSTVQDNVGSHKQHRERFSMRLRQ